jgi:holo-[acyl-carrier protein] synthase
VGVDLVSVDRIERLATEDPAALDTVFTAGELADCANGQRFERLAGRFAAKEAVLKAFGAGLLSPVEFTEIEIRSDPDGRPRARVHGALAALAAARGFVEADVSISHTAGLAMASAVVLCRPPLAIGATADAG